MNKDRLGKHISLIYRYSQIYFNEQLKKFKLGSGQYIFLMSLFENNGITQEQLAAAVKFDKATTARAVAKLEEEGYVIRKISETDKRAYNLYITDKANAIKTELTAVLDEWNRIMLYNFAEQEKENVHNLIEKIGNNIMSFIKTV
ncbi:MAG: MarR family transcriptional regulator [Negativicutes bacterium]|nr:MarR family transcriptional regulator [Negativicutes bacterium]